MIRITELRIRRCFAAARQRYLVGKDEKKPPYTRSWSALYEGEVQKLATHWKMVRKNSASKQLFSKPHRLPCQLILFDCLGSLWMYSRHLLSYVRIHSKISLNQGVSIRIKIGVVLKKKFLAGGCFFTIFQRVANFSPLPRMHSFHR